MYLDHFGLAHKPFAITPDPRFLYLSERYREALAHLLYGASEGGGFVLLTGEVGTGKTTLCRGLLEQLPEGVDAALIINPRLDALELLATLCDELHIELPDGATRSAKELADALNRYLLNSHASGRRALLIIDEAQNLSPEALEQVRLLTNLETATEKLLQIILIGQPELRDLLARRDLRQLGQRITARYHLDPMDRAELGAYIDHRLRLAGADGRLFTTAAVNRVRRASRGIPRLVNTICDRALLGAYARGKRRVDAATVAAAAREVLSGSSQTRWAPIWIALGAVLAATVGAWALVPRPTPPATPPADMAVAPVQKPAEESAPPALTAEPQDEPPPELPAAPVESAATPAHDGLDAALMDQGNALRRLAELWVPGDGLGDGPLACTSGLPPGLACYSSSVSWATLVRLDRPALLELGGGVGDDGTRHVALLALEENAAWLATPDGGRARIPLGTLLADWHGRFTTLWNPPVASRLLRPGERAAAVAWVRDQLDTAGEPAQPASDPLLFDDDLQRRVILFQVNQGLKGDGLVGSQTLLHLDSAGSGGPRLAREAG